MKSFLKTTVVCLPIIFILVLIAVYIGLNTIVHRGVETFGPTVTGTDVGLEKVSISLISGKGMIRGLTVANPEDCKTPTAFELDALAVDIDLPTLASDTIVIHSIEILAPSVTVEGLDAANLMKLQENVAANTESGEAAEEEQEEPTDAGKKVVIEHLVVRDGTIHYSPAILMGKSIPIPLPDIELEDIGKDEGGASMSDVASTLLGLVGDSVVATLKGSTDLLTLGTKEIADVAGKSRDLVEQATGESVEAVTDSAKALGDEASKIAGGIGSLLSGDKE